MDQGRFYDEIAEYYDLIYEDWEDSMRRHGAVLSELLGEADGPSSRVLDVSAGIGTQALPLATLGYEVVARDLSEGAIRRLQREARNRGLRIDAAASDVRNVGETVTGQFSGVISMDNSVPHLLTDSEIVTALRRLRGLLSPGGVLLVSVRDYSKVERTPRSSHPYGIRMRAGDTFRLSQEWEWYDDSRYRTTMVVELQKQDAWEEVVRTEAAYYAISISRLLELMREAGLDASRVDDSQFFQPVLCGRAS